ncbi:MAG: type II toxin-antitoxin system RelE/ParE family toxin [Flavobacterium sp.]|nr:MAG: type II toxin-antitoxin system RelE/ParE family toxin [Flavobacterium sp.]
MAFKIIILKRAALEIDEAVFYYENIRLKLGERFLMDYENHLKYLTTLPFFEVKYNIIRKLSFKKFPYTLHFTVDENEKIVSILAVTCDYQNPDTTQLKF